MTKPDPIPVEPLTEACIRAALARLVASRAFSQSPQLARFLTFVVEETQAGRGQRIKAYTIATDALGREASFDPQNDPIVRVEAGRLRQALDSYYATGGHDDPVVVELPRGRYVPTFRKRADRFRLGDIPATARKLFKRAAVVRVQLGVLIIAILLAAAAEVAFVHWRQAGQSKIMTTASSGPNSLTSRFTDSLLPVVYVKPIEVIGTPVESIIAPAHLRTELCDALARFDEIIVITDGACGSSEKGKLPPRPAKFTHADYVVSGRLDYGDGKSVAVTLRLVDNSDGMIVWSRTFPPIRLEADPDRAQDTIVRQAARFIAQPTGVLQAHERSRRADGAKIDFRYDCLLAYNAYRQSFDPAVHEHVKACLQQAIAKDPTFAPGFAALARIYVRQFYTYFGFEQDEPKPLDRALRLAQKAIELEPDSAEAYSTLMGVSFARRDLMAARTAGETAVMLNPNDMAVQAEYGFILLRSGEIEKAIPLMRDAIASGNVASSLVNYGLFAGAYLTGNMGEAKRYADAIATDNFPLGLTAKALMTEKSGDHAGAVQALNWLYALQPAWKTNPRRELEKVFEAKSIVDRLATDLAAIARGATN